MRLKIPFVSIYFYVHIYKAIGLETEGAETEPRRLRGSPRQRKWREKPKVRQTDQPQTSTVLTVDRTVNPVLAYLAIQELYKSHQPKLNFIVSAWDCGIPTTTRYFLTFLSLGEFLSASIQMKTNRLYFHYYILYISTTFCKIGNITTGKYRWVSFHFSVRS